MSQVLGRLGLCALPLRLQKLFWQLALTPPLTRHALADRTSHSLPPLRVLAAVVPPRRRKTPRARTAPVVARRPASDPRHTATTLASFNILIFILVRFVCSYSITCSLSFRFKKKIDSPKIKNRGMMVHDGAVGRCGRVAWRGCGVGQRGVEVQHIRCSYPLPALTNDLWRGIILSRILRW